MQRLSWKLSCKPFELQGILKCPPCQSSRTFDSNLCGKLRQIPSEQMANLGKPQTAAACCWFLVKMYSPCLSSSHLHRKAEEIKGATPAGIKGDPKMRLDRPMHTQEYHTEPKMMIITLIVLRLFMIALKVWKRNQSWSTFNDSRPKNPQLLPCAQTNSEWQLENADTMTQ